MRVLLLAALTLDGRIARHADELSDWTSREDKRLFVRTSKDAGVVVMGHATYATLPAPLPGRLLVVLTRAPDQQPARDGVEFTADPPASVLQQLAARGYTSVVLAGGARTYRAFLAAGLVDELWLTIEPVAFGAGIGLFGDEPFAARFTLLDCQRLGDNAVHLRYRAVRGGEAPA